jgi:peptide/nickel transport system permease protein
MVSSIVLYIIRRGVNAVITLLLLIALLFIILHSIVRTPVGLARIICGNPHCTDAAINQIIKTNGLTNPIYIQFLTYVSGIFHGNFGIDTIYKSQPELTVIGKFLPVTLELVITGSVIGILIGIYTGSIAASNRNRVQDYVVKAVYLTTWSTPVFLVAFLGQLFFAYWLNLLPATRIANPFLSPPKVVTGAPVLDSLIDGDWTYFYSSLQHIILPALAIAVAGFGIVTRLTRASMIDALDRDYVKLAYMKGLSKRQVVWGTAFRNAVIPIITLIALTFAFSVGGAVIIEDVFQYYGMGFFTVQAIYNFDYEAVLAVTLIVGIAVIMANLAADLLYAAADPRVRLT